MRVSEVIGAQNLAAGDTAARRGLSALAGAAWRRARNSFRNGLGGPWRSSTVRAGVAGYSLAVADQAVFSGSQFLFQVLLARWLELSGYGLFAVWLTVQLFALGLHDAWILEPYTVFAPSRSGRALRRYEAAAARLCWAAMGALALLIAAGAVLAAPSGHWTTAWACAAATPPVAALWLRRRMDYNQGHSVRSFFQSLTYATLLLLLTGLARRFGLLSPVVAYGIQGLGAGAVLLLRAHVAPAPGAAVREPIGLAEAAAEHLRYARWTSATTALYFAGTQFQSLCVAALSGLQNAALLRAALNFSLPLNQLVVAAGLCSLPPMARAYGRGDHEEVFRWRRRVTVGLFLTAACCGAALYFLREFLDSAVYGGKLGGHALLVPLLACVPLASAAGSGDSLLLRAVRRPDLHFWVTMSSACAGLLSAFQLIGPYGVWGAAASMVAAASGGAIALRLLGAYVVRRACPFRRQTSGQSSSDIRQPKGRDAMPQTGHGALDATVSAGSRCCRRRRTESPQPEGSDLW